MTLVLYTWNLTASGYANSFYSAAVQAGSESWKAFFFGSSDAANSITVDKPPASLWVMALSVRLLGLSSFAILLPQALMGVATVGVVYTTVKRQFGAAAGLIAGVVLALTPVAALMFTFNNPDALLTLLMALGAWATIKAIEQASPKWMMIVGVFIGLGFLTKTLQVLLVVPFFGLAYLIAAPTTLRKRIVHSLLAVGTMVLSAGWWVAIVELVPASARPYIGGSQTNSFLELTFGYNGLGRLSGDETGSVGGGGGGAPVAACGARPGCSGCSPRASATRSPGSSRARSSCSRPASGCGAVARAPTCAARPTSSGAAGSSSRSSSSRSWPASSTSTTPWPSPRRSVPSSAWVRSRPGSAARAPSRTIALAAATAAAATWSFILLSRTTAYGDWLRISVLAVGMAAALLILATRWMHARAVPVVLAAALVAGLAGPGAYAVSTTAQGHSGSIVTAGPAGSSRGPGGGGGFGGGTPAARPARPDRHQRHDPQGGPQTGGAGGGMGGLLDASTPSTAVVAALSANADRYTWVAAAVGSQTAAGLQLGTQLPGHGHRRLQRLGPEPDARAVPAVRRQRPDPLLRQRRKGIRQPERWQQRLVGDQLVGAGRTSPR